MANYLVVLFKNKTRKKIIKKFITLSRAKNYFKQLIKESDDVIFEVLVENGKECRFELGLIEMSVNQSAPVYMTDDFGRSVKVILQKDEEIDLFSLKNESECARFVESLSSHFFKTKRGDCLFIKDCSSPQRKYLYSLLESNGFDKKVLYRKFTTYPVRPK
jgi:hypothetical protein